MNLKPTFDIVQRPTTHYVFLEKHGPFAEVAPPCWEALFPLLRGQLDDAQIISFLGLSTIDKTRKGEDGMIYQAGVGVATRPQKPLKGLQYKRIRAGSYARFLLTGSYSQIGVAFDRIFKTLAENNVQLRPEFCVENYLNDPKVTPEDQLKTEVLVPVA